MKQQCSAIKQNKGRCSVKTKRIFGVCEYGCEKHAPNSQIFDCGKHTMYEKKWDLQPCRYNCEGCNKTLEFGVSPWGRRVAHNFTLIVHPDMTNFYCSEKCFKSSDESDDLGKKYINQKCLVCDLFGWCEKPVDNFLCQIHKKFQSKLDMGMKYKKCSIDTKDTIFSCTISEWVNQSDDFYCSEHIKYKEAIDSGKVYKKCILYNYTLNHSCYESGWVEKDDTYWCPNHQAEKLKYGDNYEYKRCYAHSLANQSCYKNGWTEKDENFWCDHHLQLKQYHDEGYKRVRCIMSSITGYCGHYEWAKDNDIVWCSHHKHSRKKYLKLFLQIYANEFSKLEKKLKDLKEENRRLKLKLNNNK